MADMNKRRVKATSQSAIQSAKDRLKQYTSILDLEQDMELFPTSGSLAASTSAAFLDNWRTGLVSCGSNAFGQINLDLDLMCSTLKSTPLPIPAESASSSSSKSSSSKASPLISYVSCGNTISAAVMDEVCYIWGAGLPGAPLRVPTPLHSIPQVSYVSCGHSHVALVTSVGAVYTWGAGDHGMLGHGTKQAVMAPRIVTAFSGLVVSSVSCGAYHTGFVACKAEDMFMTPIPDRENSRGQLDPERDWLKCGSLYMCGLGKAGQLGIDFGSTSSDKLCVTTPTHVSSLDEQGLRVAKVSCGMHHSLILAIPAFAARTFSTVMLSCGWGEHGRLGLGDEEGRNLPSLIQFPAPFHPVEISAGEQHSLASGREGCYAWGSNSMGQLGVGSPATTEFSMVPMKIPIPEGMQLRQIGAGGRHSAGITGCGRVLAWGWGEEGQLGHGSEKNSFLPRPCRVPKVRGKAAVPIALSLGMCHTVIAVSNPQYVSPPTPVPSPIKMASPEPVKRLPTPPPTPEPIVESPQTPEPEPEPEPIVFERPPSPIVIVSPPKEIVLRESIRDLLQRREERRYVLC